MLNEAKRLYDLGFAVHWIKPNSKAPVDNDWNKPRDSWRVLEGKYQDGVNLGVRLGPYSKLTGGYAANIDIDIKSSEPRHKKEALDFVKRTFPDLIKTAPIIKTGLGFRLFVLLKEPVESKKLKASGEETVVFMPTSPVNRRQANAVKEGRLTQEQLDAGYRLRPAWEVEFMSLNRQVILPPSIHPDTGKAYVWQKELDPEKIPLIDPPTGSDKSSGPADKKAESAAPPFTPVEVDLDALGLRPRYVEMIRDGKDRGQEITDRSSALLSAAMAMVKAKLSDDEILSVLTDKRYFLGEAAFEHRKTKSRASAADWIRKYTLKKAKHLILARQVFADEVTVTDQEQEDNPAGIKVVRAEQTVVALTKIKPPREAQDVTNLLKRSGKNGDGPVMPTLQNTITVLARVFARDVFRLNLSLMQDYYGCDVPWGRYKGEAVTDRDFPNIIYWLSVNYDFEPSRDTVYNAVTTIGDKNAYHPVRDELNNLPMWDGVPRLDTWLKTRLGASGPKEYLAQVFRKWLVASVTRTFQPGAKFDWLPIFEGLQGIGKSRLGEIIFGEDNFIDKLPHLENKDAALSLVGMRGVEFNELTTLSKSDLEEAKGFITRRIDKVRPHYGRIRTSYPRECVFYGTTNKSEYLRDDGGNRRFNPVKVNRVLDVAALIAERDQLWAEAMFIYENGLERTLYLEGDALTYSIQIQQEKMVPDDSNIMAEMITDFIELERKKPADQRFPFHSFRMADLFSFGPLSSFKYDARHKVLAGKALAGELKALKEHTKRGSVWQLNVDS